MKKRCVKKVMVYAELTTVLEKVFSLSLRHKHLASEFNVKFWIGRLHKVWTHDTAHVQQ